MADLRDYTKNNQIFAGTDGIRLPSGNSAQRVASANVAGTMRYNTDIAGMELYTPTGWLPIAAPPSIATVSPSTYSGASGTEFTINGSNFTSDAQVYFVTSNGTAILASTVTYYSSVQVRATTPRAIKVEEEPISVRVVQQSGTVTKLDCIDAGGVPNWITTAGTLGSIFGANTVNVYVSATDPEGTAITYQISSGSLPGGLNFSTANGLIQGVASSVLANTTYNFTIKANDTVNNNTDRTFSYTVLNRAPVINTAAGSLGTIYSGNATSASISAYDPDGGQLTYSVSSGTLPVNSSLGSANGVITGTPVVVTTNTTYSFTLTSTDEGSLTASNNYTYTVLNRPPLWNTNPTLTSYSAETFIPITVNAYDPDGGSITYSLTSGSVPSGLTFVTANATITGTAPEVTDNTTSTFAVTATDPGADANVRTFSLTITPIIDAQFSNTMLLIHGSANTVIKDESSNSLPLTVVGDARGSNFSPFNTSWSNYFGTYASDNYLTYVPGTSVAFGTGDFTVECWAYWDTDPGATANPYIIDTRGGGGAWAFSWNWNGTSSGSVLAWTKADGIQNQASTLMPLYQWNHCAYVRSGTTGTIYLNGVSILSFTDSTNYSASISLAYLGKRYSGSQSNPGYLSNLRIVKGTAVYTSAFTPPTSRLTTITNTVLLTCQDNTFKDSSTANSGTGFGITQSGTPRVTGWSPFAETDTTTGSIFFDGTGDYISNLPSNILDFTSSEEFSIEFFAYFNSVPNSFGMLGLNAGIQQGYCIVYDVGGGHYLLSGKTDEIGSASLLRTQSAGTLYPYKWHHICFARRSGVMSIYLDGVRVATRSSDTTTYASGAATIGYAGQGSATAMTGFMSNMRIITGSSVYDTSQTTLTVPTSSVSNVANTRLLTFQNRQPHNNHGIIDNSRNKLMITRNGNVSQGTFTPFSADPGKWSVFFNGSSGVRFADNAAFQFGTSAFTVEGWFNVNSTPSNDASVISKWVAGNDGNSSWMVDFQSSNLSAAISIGGSVTRISGTVGVPLGVWNHFALVRSGSPGTLSLFMNGARIATGTPTGSLVDDSNALGLGVRGGTDGQYLTGSLTNIRIINGTALYDPTLTSYTVPTSTLGVVTNTKLLTCQNNQFIDNSTANSSAGFTATALSTPFVRPFSPFAPNTVYTTANTGGGAYFDGTGDYLLTPSIQNLAFRTGPFTMESWHYGTTTSGGGQLVSSRTGSINDAASISFYITGGNYSFYGNGNHVSAAYVTGQWNHVVYTRDASSTLRLFINGKLAAYEASYTPDITNKQIGIGSLQSGGEIIPACWASDIRLITGSIPTSYQTSSTTVGTQVFSIPTAPLTVTSQGALANAVTLLLNFTDAAIIDSSAKNIFETSGDAKSNNTISKFNGGSAYLDGSADFLILPATAASPLGTVNFTWECWIYRNAVTESSYADGLCVSSAGITGFGAGIDPSGYIGYAISATSGSWDIRLGVDPGNPKGSIAVPLRTWTHVALVRNGSTFTGYVNGQVDQTFTSASAISNLGNSYYIGRWHDANTRYFNGHIQEFRITRSARYTTTFTPPTRSFPNR
jgi:hypothetical protein